MKDLLRRFSFENQDMKFIFSEKREIDVKALNRKVDQIVAFFTKNGLELGDRIVIIPNNTIEHIILILASCRLGLEVAIVNSRLTGDEQEEIISYFDPKMVMREFPRKIENDNDSCVDNFSRSKLILFTSGTTGKPKAVVHTMSSVLANCRGSEERLETKSGDIWLLTLPLFHVGGLSIIFRALYSQMAIYLMEKFDVQKVFQLLEEKRISLLSLVPTMLYRMIKRDVKLLKNVRVILLGGARPTDKLLEYCIKESLPVYTTYGQTETFSQVVTAFPEMVYRDKTTVGTPLLGVEIEIRDSEGKRVALNTIGEIWVKGENVMERYLGEEPVNGVIATGDSGYIDDRGELHVLGRISEMIITGGENVFPLEVEEAILELDEVESVCVVGVPDEEWGERIGAVIVLRKQMTQSQLVERLKEKIAGYKIPKQVMFAKKLPTNTTGKIDRKSVKQLLKMKPKEQ